MSRDWTKAMFLVGLVVAGFSVRALATKPLPFAKQRATVRALVYGANTPSQRGEAIRELMRIVGDQRQDRWLRTFAAEGLGELGAVEAESLLRELANRLRWTEADTRLKSAAHLGEWQVRVAKETRTAKKIQLLEKAGTDRFDGLIEWRVQDWAGSELANMGIGEAMPEIIDSIKRRGA